MLSRFLSVESCGQCPPCKLGTGAITAALDDIATGRGGDETYELINHWLAVVTDGNRCFLPVEEQQMIGEHPARRSPRTSPSTSTGPCPSPRRARRARRSSTSTSAA